MDLNIADAFIIITIAISTIIGIYRGFIRELLTVITWVIGGFLAYMYGNEAGEYCFFLEDAFAKEIVGMIAIFMSVVFIGLLLKLIVCKAAKISGVSKVDRVTGALFGALRGCLVIVFVLYLSSNNITNQDWYKNSQLLPRFTKVAKMIPKSLEEDVKKSLEEDIKKEVDDLMHKEQPPAPVVTAQPVEANTESSTKPSKDQNN